MKIRTTTWVPYIFLSPFFVLFAIFGLYPIGYSIYISLFDWGMGGPTAFVGIDNYTRFFTVDPLFFRSLGTTFILLVIGSLSQHIIALPIAVLLNQKFIKLKEFFRAAIFIPYITSSVCVAIVFQQLFNPDVGMLNYLVHDLLGFDRVKWLSDPTAIKASIAIVLNWRYIGYYVIIYLGGLQTIPKDIYEAADIDGVSTFKKHLYLTMPMLVPIIFFGVSLSLIFGMQLFDEPYLLTGGYNGLGGTANAGLTTTLYMMTQGFRFARFGRAAAISWLTFIVIIILTLGAKRITDAVDYTKEGR